MPSIHESPPPPPIEFVVGIGASAGGLEPLARFFAEMPSSSGVAFVVVQHVSISFKGLMGELLARHTEMPIHRIEEGMALAPNSVYLIPPSMEVTVHEGRLHLTEQERATAAPQLPIDALFQSLADGFGLHAIGIIMSGTGSDGSRGLRSIKEAGGLMIAQDHASAKFDGMPRSSIDTGGIDCILPPEEMAAAVLGYCKDPGGFKGDEETELAGAEIDSILQTLREETELDFSQYKPSTVRGRIERRAEVRHAASLDQYADILRADPDEVHKLYKDLLIGVTRFFRDREAFRRMEEAVIPELFKKDAGATGEIRVWVAGCATGEEAYSLAILFHEHAGRLQSPPKIRIFATDAHRTSLEFASVGRYGKHILSGVTPSRLNAYFEPVGDEYQVINELREMITFAPHDLLHDSPFMRVDLVTCRNLLIYFQVPAQMRVLHLFHRALRVGGVLFLGPSETVGTLKPEFASIDSYWRVYRKRRHGRPSGESQASTATAESHARITPLQPIPDAATGAKDEGFDSSSKAPGELRTAEPELRLTKEDLQARVKELEAANEELCTANSELAARNQELDQFAHAASHDLRSPLRSVVGFADIVRDALADGDMDEAEKSLERIDEAAHRMGNLIDSLLMFASVGRGQLLVGDVSINWIFENVIKDLAPEIKAQGAVIQVDPELPTLEGDATMLHQVFQNLVANSIKYRGDDSPEIAVSATTQDDRVRVTIADNGIGFDPADAERAFAPFQRLHSGHASRGSGIGLSICRRVVERHGGSIEVETAVGEGARFTVELPLKQPVVEA